MSILQLKKSSSFSDDVVSGDEMALELVTGTNAEGKPHYAVLLLPASKLKDLRIALSRKDVVLEEYGKVLAKGEGHEPHPELIDDILGLLTKK